MQDKKNIIYTLNILFNRKTSLPKSGIFSWCCSLTFLYFAIKKCRSVEQIRRVKCLSAYLMYDKTNQNLWAASLSVSERLYDWFQHWAQRSPLLREFSREAHARERYGVFSACYCVKLAGLQVVCHAGNVGELPLVHSVKGSAESPHLK